MSGELAGRVVAVTGGHRGIGRAITEAMAEAGAAVVIGCRDPGSAVDVVAAQQQLGRVVSAAACEVTDDASTRAWAATVQERHGRVDVVVANAGIAGPTKPLHEIDPAEWRECVDVDLTGVYLTFRPFLASMISQRSGRLIAVSSVTAKRPLVGRTPYAAAKMGIIGLVRTLAAEVGPYGICANTVCAGSVAGPRLDAVVATAAAARGISADEARREHEAPAALQRLVRAEEVARTCVFLASEAASAITGEDLNVSAGAVMY